MALEFVCEMDRPDIMFISTNYWLAPPLYEKQGSQAAFRCAVSDLILNYGLRQIYPPLGANEMAGATGFEKACGLQQQA
jgi:hypothetical protein